MFGRNRNNGSRGYDRPPALPGRSYNRPAAPPPPTREGYEHNHNQGYSGSYNYPYEREHDYGQSQYNEGYNQVPTQHQNQYSGHNQGQGGNNQYQRPPGPPPQYAQENMSSQGNYQRPPGAPPQTINNPDYGNAPNSYTKPSVLAAPPTQPQQFGGNYSDQTWQYSQCTGRRKALIIGINYIGSPNKLNGCINDAHNIFNFLTTRYGYSKDDIVMLTDDQNVMAKVPTRDNIIRAMRWLVKDARQNDALFFHYSGHGGLTQDLDGDEESGYDSVIYPVDFQTAGQIVDDEIHAIMVKSLPQGVRLTALFDSCHSGSVLDLPYTYSTKGVIKEPNLWKDVGQEGLQAAFAYASGNKEAMFRSLGSLVSTVTKSLTNKSDRQKVIQMKFSPADIIMFSGSKDDQTSADTVEGGQSTGAMSYAFIKVLTNQPQQSYLSLLQNMRAELRGKYSQKPQLSSSHPIDVNLQFVM